MSHPVFEIVKTSLGAVSIRDKTVDEILHNPVGPWNEANALYVDQSRLKVKLQKRDEGELVLFDVGLGAAANALASIACAKTLGSASRPLRIISFERNLELLKFALTHSAQFEHFREYESVLERILTVGEWSSDNVSWDLRFGEFLEKIESEKYRAHLIFFDPYSPVVNSEMWTTSCFEKIRRLSREPRDGGTSLYTYSQATRVRAAMLRAGFFVGYGVGTGWKGATTVATTERESLAQPLDQAWYKRWQKSHLRYPFDCGANDESAFDSFMAVPATFPGCG
jgi:queuine tRNA-ribosyltransferase